MKNVLLPALLSLFLFPHPAFSQEYSYMHYDIEQGLAGSTLYCITQDKEGFIWTGTQAGVSRFDGSHFKNFTTKDGLPDLEVLQIFGDSKGRVWMAPFRKSLCYYFKGKIYNEHNDSLLSLIHLQHNVESFAEDAAGNILIQERNALHLVYANGSLANYDSLDHEPIRRCLAVSASPTGHFLAQVGGKIIEFSARGVIRSMTISFPWDNPNDIALSPQCSVCRQLTFNATVCRLFTATTVNRPLDPTNDKHISFSIVDDSLVYSNLSSGSSEYNVHTGQIRQLLPGMPVSRVFRDASGNLWFTTLGKGLFRLNSNDIRTIHLAADNAEKTSITALTKIGRELLAGNDRSTIFKLSLPNLAILAAQPFAYSNGGRILFVDTVMNNKILTGSDYGLIEGSRQLHYIRELVGGIKSVARISDRQLLLACSWGAGILNLPAFQIRDTLWHERSTVAFYKDDTTYIGTLNGLYRSVKGRPLVFLGEKTPFLRRRISSITESANGTLWIASYDDAGILGYKNDRQVAILDHSKGLTSDICTTLMADHDILWAGTDKGLNRIELDRHSYPVTRYSARDGLASDMINTLLVDDSIIYVGTAAGLSYFDTRKTMIGEECRLYLLSIINSGRERIKDTAGLLIPYTDKRVRFEFAALSYRSAGDIVYKYRILGQDTSWQETRETFVDYQDLPSGHYEWQLIATNKFGNQSRMLTLPMEVSVQFWKRLWFVILIWLLSLAIFLLLAYSRIRRIRRRQNEKAMLMQKMNELENTALKSQMNPHFIFNCLNSIQQSIFSGDTMSANSYIAGLAGLIRMTLNNSSRTFVVVKEEVDYLSSYLELEKMRFKDKIDYEITVDPSIDQSNVLIPPMLIQPYVENSLHHGLQYKEGGSGHISIRMDRQGDLLVVTIEDNGVGRTHKKGKMTDYRGHSPKGMALTEDRIIILRALYGNNIGIEILDLLDASASPAGTRILIRLPFFQEKEMFF